MRLTAIMNEFAAKGLLAVSDWAALTVRKLLRMDANSLDWEPASGYYGIAFFSPIPIEDLWSLPAISPASYISDMKTMAASYLPRMPFNQWALSDLFYTMKPSTSFSDLLPPFKGQLSFFLSLPLASIVISHFL